jgi:hypothetical protein
MLEAICVIIRARELFCGGEKSSSDDEEGFTSTMERVLGVVVVLQCVRVCACVGENHWCMARLVKLQMKTGLNTGLDPIRSFKYGTVPLYNREFVLRVVVHSMVSGDVSEITSGEMMWYIDW